MQRVVALLVVAGALVAGEVSAHHSFSAAYLEDQRVTVEGQLAQFLFRNPHSIVHLVAKDKAGREVRYAVEWAAAGELESQGVTHHTLKIGDHVVVTGYPARDPRAHRIRMTTLRRPRDNFNYDAAPGR